MATPVNYIQQYEQSLANVHIPPGTYLPLSKQSAPIQIPNYAPITSTVPSSGFDPSTLLSGSGLVIGVFGVSLLVTILGSGTVRTLGVVGMLGSVGLFLVGVSQIH